MRKYVVTLYHGGLGTEFDTEIQAQHYASANGGEIILKVNEETFIPRKTPQELMLTALVAYELDGLGEGSVRKIKLIKHWRKITTRSLYEAKMDVERELKSQQD